MRRSVVLGLLGAFVTGRWVTGDSGVLQGATFRLRLMCDGRPIVLRSRTGATWSR